MSLSTLISRSGLNLDPPSEVPISDPNDPNIGKRLGNYRITRALDSGGMGRVYLARHAYLDRTVAVKLLHDDFARDLAALERFIQEAQAASAVEHANIVRILDFGQAPGVANGGIYLVMEYVEGAYNLSTLLEAEGRLPAHRAINILNQVLRALEAVHARSIVHGDIKPENILIQRRPGRRRLERTVRDAAGHEQVISEPEPFFDFAKICDFGTAFLMKTGKAGGGDSIMGTPDYMAPEIARGNPYDHRADLYALGVMFFELLTGQVPFVGETAEEVLRAHVFKAAPDPREVAPGCDCSEPAAALIARAMKKNPTERYQSAYELRLDLLNCYTDVHYPAPTPEIANSRTAPAAPPPNSAPKPRVTPNSQHKLGGLLKRIFG